MGKLRVLATVIVALVATGMVGSPAFAKPKPRVNIDDACTLVTVKNVERAFGAPVLPERAGPLPTLVCYVLVGADSRAAPGGTLTATIEYRRGNTDASDGIDAVERILDPDLAGGVNVEPLEGVGKVAYLYPDDGGLLVAASKKLAFRLLWAPAGQTAPLTPEARAGLIRVAKDTVKRAS